MTASSEHAEELTTFTLTALMDSEAAESPGVSAACTPSATATDKSNATPMANGLLVIVTGLFHVD
jgi:hypothetical protein